MTAKETMAMGLLRVLIVFLCLIALTLPAVAWDGSDDLYPDYTYSNPYSNPYDSYGNPQYRYKGSSGLRYRYDLSKPGDRIRYQLDIDAQIRDSINPDPRIDLDRELG